MGESSIEKPFWIDGIREYSYARLLSEFDTEQGYYPCRAFGDTYELLRNLILALLYGRPVTLLDSDISACEVKNLLGEDGVQTMGEKQELSGKVWSSVEQIIETVMSSQSPITIFTSGTTGQPKRVVHTPATLMRSVRRGPQYSENVWGYAYNPTHMAGMQVFFQALANQCTLVNLFGKERGEIYGLIDRWGVSHLSATPTFYRLLLPADSVHPGVVRVTFGGEKSTPKLHEQIQHIFPNARVNNIYASTEAGSLFVAHGDTFCIPDNISDKVRISPQGELQIERSLLGRSDTFHFTPDGYYPTGDLVEWSDEGHTAFRFVSRRGELINIGGYKVNPNEVEEQVLTLEGIQACSVYGRENSVLGMVLCCDIVATSGATGGVLTEQGVRETLSARLQDYKVPRRVRFVEHLEITKTGKLKRQ